MLILPNKRSINQSIKEDTADISSRIKYKIKLFFFFVLFFFCDTSSKWPKID